MAETLRGHGGENTEDCDDQEHPRHPALAHPPHMAATRTSTDYEPSGDLPAVICKSACREPQYRLRLHHSTFSGDLCGLRQELDPHKDFVAALARIPVNRGLPRPRADFAKVPMGGPLLYGATPGADSITIGTKQSVWFRTKPQPRLPRRAPALLRCRTGFSIPCHLR